MSRPGKIRVLNLYAGIGGNRKSWEDVDVVAVEDNEEIAGVYQDFFPGDEVIVADAHQYLLEHYDEFDFIWSSPPCKTHSRIGYLSMKTREKYHRGELPTKSGSKEITYPDLKLYEEIIFLTHFRKDKPWVVENTMPYYVPLISPTARLDRHCFWSNFPIRDGKFSKPEVRHNKVTGKTTRFGISIDKYRIRHRKDQIIRNCVNPQLGKHVLICGLSFKGHNLGIKDSQLGIRDFQVAHQHCWRHIKNPWFPRGKNE